VVHLDLTPQNIYVTENGTLKIGKFSLCRVCDHDIYAKDVGGTLLYMAPEALLGEKVSQKADVWALGCIIHELCNLE
jgi:NIMA (never in mitosis gene a)-related kinase